MGEASQQYIPPPVTERCFANFDEMAEAIHQADLDFTLLERPRGDWRLLQVCLDRCQLQVGSDETSHISTGVIKPDMAAFLISLDERDLFVVNSYRLQGGRLVLFQPGAELYACTGKCTHWASLAVPPDELDRVIRALTGREAPRLSSGCTMLEPSPQACQSILHSLHSAISIAMANPDDLSSREVRQTMEQSLLTSFVRGMTSAGAIPRPSRATVSRERILRRAEEYLRNCAGKPVQIAELCSATGVSQRSLFYAFQDAYDTSPIRYLKLRRLCRVHQELRQADPLSAGVASIAGRWGFTELGRFAGEYRQIFGETPSRTLRRL